MKRSLLLILCLVLAVVMVSCGQPEDPCAEGHAFSEAWKSDATNHWHAATCEHTDEKSGLAAHTGLADDGVCDVCEWSDVAHEHEFDDENWSSDATFHWHASTCGHSAVVDGKVPHTYEDGKSGCTTCGYGHKHTYSDEWTSDENGHWNVNTCEHAGKINEAAHTDTNNDGDCDTCGYNGGHVHTYDEENVEWLSDTTTHWNPATCGHDVKLNVGYHLDGDDDGKCDECGVQAHSYATKWSTNTTHHYHVADCGCCLVSTDFAAHEDTDNDNACDECGYFMGDVLTLLGSSITSDAASKVNKVVIKDGYYNYTVEFGTGVTKILKSSEWGDTTYYYLPFTDKDEVNKVMVIIEEDGYIYRTTSLDSNEYFGFNFSSIYDGVYGTEAVISALYSLVTSDETKNMTYGYNQTYDAEKGTYTVTFGYKAPDASTLAIYGISFKAEDGIVSSAEIAVGVYYDGFFVNNYEKSYIAIGDPAYATGYEVDQTAGERTLTTELKTEDYLISEIELDYRLGWGGELVDVVDNETVINVYPSQFIYFEYPSDLESLYAGSEINLYIYLDSERTILGENYEDYMSMQTFSFAASKAGTFYVTYEAEMTSINFTVVSEYLAPTTITAKEHSTDYPTEFTEKTIFVGDKLDVSASMGTGENPAYTAALVGDNASNAALTLSNDGSVYTFFAPMTGAYSVQFKSTVDESVVTTATINVVEKPSLEEIIKGTHEYYMGSDLLYEVIFTPSADNFKVGTVQINDNNTWSFVECNYVFDEDSFEFTLTATDGYTEVPFDLVIKDYKVTAVVYSYYGKQEYAMTQKTETAEEDNSIQVSGEEFTVTVTDNDLQEYIDFYTYTATVDGVHNFHVPYGLGFWLDGDIEPTIDYKNQEYGVDSKYTIYLAYGETLKFSVGSSAKDDFTITVTYGEESEEGPVVSNVLVLGENTVNFANMGETFGKDYTFTAEVAGTYTFEYSMPQGVAIECFIGEQMNYSVSSLELEAGQTITLTIKQNNTMTGDFAVFITLAE